MSAVRLEWRSVTPNNSSNFLTKGAELSNALCGRNCRFQICEHRAYTKDFEPDVIYRVRDADTVSDADVKNGKRPVVVSSFRELDDAIEFCLSHG